MVFDKMACCKISGRSATDASGAPLLEKKCYHEYIQLRRVAKAAILSAALISLFEQWKNIQKEKNHWQNSEKVQPAIAQSTLESCISQFNLQGEQFQVFRNHLGIANSAENFHSKIYNQNISKSQFLAHLYRFIGNSFTPIPSCCHKNWIHRWPAANLLLQYHLQRVGHPVDLRCPEVAWGHHLCLSPSQAIS